VSAIEGTPSDLEAERRVIEPDPYAKDPFFARVNNPEWNACIGVQGSEGNHLDGYIEAAIELAEAVIQKEMYEKRDTLVLPILYNARHAVELALKFATDRLAAINAIKADSHKRDHNIKAFWDRLHTGGIGDEELQRVILALKPYADSVAQIDSDGQELRYHRNREDNPSLANFSLANLQLIRASLHELQELLSSLKYRTVEFVLERATGSFTNRCSRRDLFTISRMFLLSAGSFNATYPIL